MEFYECEYFRSPYGIPWCDKDDKYCLKGECFYIIETKSKNRDKEE